MRKSNIVALCLHIVDRLGCDGGLECDMVVGGISILLILVYSNCKLLLETLRLFSLAYRS